MSRWIFLQGKKVVQSKDLVLNNRVLS
jgi:hypothetical protein